MNGGLPTFAAPARASCPRHESGHSGLRVSALRCCAEDQGQLCADSALCKVGAIICDRDMPNPRLISAVHSHETPLCRDKEKADVLSSFSRHVGRTEKAILSDYRQPNRLMQSPFLTVNVLEISYFPSCLIHSQPLYES